MNRTRLLIASLGVNAVLGLVALGWLAWISLAPSYWFPGAYAEQGPVGEKGPRGNRGDVGPPGPVGPDAAYEIDELSSAITDLGTTIEDLSSRLDDLENETGTSLFTSDFEQLQSDLDDLETLVSNICDQFSAHPGGALEEIYFAAC